MGNISGRDIPTAEAVARESARRAFLKAPDVDALVERHRVDVIEAHMRSLTELIAPGSATRQEATRLFLLKTAEQLAGEGATPILKMIALSIVLFDAESHMASSRVLASAKDHWVPNLSLVRWRESAELRLNAKMKTLAFVRNMEESALSRSLSRLKLVAG
jgi:hypothetical protein